MAATPAAIQNIQANLKYRLNNEIIKLIPTWAILQSGVIPGIKQPDASAELGRAFLCPRKVKNGHGITYLGSAGASADLIDSTPMQVLDTQVIGYEINNRQRATHKTFFSSNANAQAAKSFESMVELMMADMTEVTRLRNEVSALYGQSGVATIQTVTGVTDTNLLTIIVTESEWSAAFWAINLGATFEFFNGTSQRGTTIGTLETVVGSTRSLGFRMVGGSGGGGTWESIAANDTIYFQSAYDGSTTWNEQIGLYKQMSATTGTLFNDNVALYPLLQGTTQAIGSTVLTKALVQQAAMKCVEKGQKEKLVCLVNAPTFADLQSEEMAQRMFDTSFSRKKSESGSEEIVYNYPFGQITVVCHPLLKRGHAIVVNPKELRWVGATDLRFGVPGGAATDGEYPLFVQVPGTNTVEIQCVLDRQIFLEGPARNCLITGIVPASST